MFKPLLAPNNDPMSYPSYFDELKFPLLCSPKLDGIRCNTIKGECLSRTLKPLPSKQIQELFGKCGELDGEIIIGNPCDEDVYNRTQSHVMSFDKLAIDARFYIFDVNYMHIKDAAYTARLDVAYGLVEMYKSAYPDIRDQIHLVEQVMCYNLQELWDFEAKCLNAGYEGIMMRDPSGIYKHGRGTFKQGIIYKLKRFADDEGVIVDIIEGTNNNNTKGTDERGYSKRSTAKEGLSASGLVGTFIVDFSGEHVNVAPGKFNHDERKYIWEHKEAYIGELLKFRHFPRGVKEKPRFPRAIGFRDRMDT